MIIYFVESFTKIYAGQVDRVTPFNKALDDLTDSVNCVVASHPFFETYQVICYLKRHYKVENELA